MISKSELTMGRDKQFPQDYTKEVDRNLNVLLEKMNVIRSKYGVPMSISSGWRPPSINGATAGAAKASKHLVGLACDVRDTDNKLWNWCIENLELMQELGIYLEDRRYTSTWVHFQVGPPKSGLRIFKPSAVKAPAPHLWDGKYDIKFNKA